MTVVSNIIERMISIMEGATCSRSIPSSRFRHVPSDLSLTVQMASQRPRPFRISPLTSFQPEDAPSSLCGDQIWSGETLAVNVAYASQGMKELDLFESIEDDKKQIVRALGYPENFSSVTGYSRSTPTPYALTEDESGSIVILTVPFNVTYREDLS